MEKLTHLLRINPLIAKAQPVPTFREYLFLIVLATVPLFSCSQQHSSPKQNKDSEQIQSQGPGTFHFRSEVWENGKRRIIDTTITLGSGGDGFFQFGDSLMGGNQFDFNSPGGGFNFSFPGDGNGFFSDSLFSSPFNFGMPQDMMKMFEEQQKMMEDMMKQMPHRMPMPQPAKPKGEYDEEIIDL